MKKSLIASGYILSVIGLFLSFIALQVPSQFSYCMLTVYPFFFASRFVTLAGLVLMGFGFLYSPRKMEADKPTIQQSQTAWEGGASWETILFRCCARAVRKVVGIYAFAYLFPILAALIAWIPLLGSNIASLTYPFSFYAIFMPLTIVFFAPFYFLLLSLLPLEHSSSVNEPFLAFAWFVLLGSVLLYLVISYFLLRGSRVAWILSFVSSLATLSLDIYSISASRSTEGVVFSFGIVMNCLVLYLLYSCRTEFFDMK